MGNRRKGEQSRLHFSNKREISFLWASYNKVGYGITQGGERVPKHSARSATSSVARMRKDKKIDRAPQHPAQAVRILILLSHTIEVGFSMVFYVRNIPGNKISY